MIAELHGGGLGPPAPSSHDKKKNYCIVVVNEDLEGIRGMRVAWSGYSLVESYGSATTLCAVAFNNYITVTISARGSVVCMTIGYGLDGPGGESQWRRGFLRPSRPANPASYTVGTGSLSRG